MGSCVFVSQVKLFSALLNWKNGQQVICEPNTCIDFFMRAFNSGREKLLDGGATIHQLMASLAIINYILLFILHICTYIYMICNHNL